MSDSPNVNEVVKGDGYAVANLDDLGEGYGFRKIRKELDVESMGMNAVVFPPGFEALYHYHDEQEEIYFVHRGTFEISFGDGKSFRLEEGGIARVSAKTHRRLKNVGDTDGTAIIVGAKDGYIGRDGHHVT